MYNFVNADGKLLSNSWFYAAVPSAGDDGFPAAVRMKNGGRWHILYGRKEDGSPDMSAKSSDADIVRMFSCGLAVVARRKKSSAEYKYGYVDASLNTVGPGELPFSDAETFKPMIYGGMWAYVETAPECKGGATGVNLMGRDGTLAFGKDSDALPRGLALDSGNGKGGTPMLIATYRKRNYFFNVSGDWSKISRIGIGDEGRDEPLDTSDGRLTLRTVWDRDALKMRKGFVARVKNGEERFVCLLNGIETKD